MLLPETGEGWRGGGCRKHAEKAMKQATVMDTVPETKGWVVKPGLEVVKAIAELYQVEIKT